MYENFPEITNRDDIRQTVKNILNGWSRDDASPFIKGDAELRSLASRTLIASAAEQLGVALSKEDVAPAIALMLETSDYQQASPRWGARYDAYHYCYKLFQRAFIGLAGALDMLGKWELKQPKVRGVGDPQTLLVQAFAQESGIPASDIPLAFIEGMAKVIREEREPRFFSRLAGERARVYAPYLAAYWRVNA